jgi:hypothetical protein
LAAVGCGGGDDDDDDKGGACSTPKVTGSPSTFFDGTATIKGTGTLAAGPVDGDELDLLIDGASASEGIYPQGVFKIPTVCGSTFTYEITNVAAGTYTLTYEVYKPNSDDLDPAFTATSKSSVTVADGATVTFDPTF